MRTDSHVEFGHPSPGYSPKARIFETISGMKILMTDVVSLSDRGRQSISESLTSITHDEIIESCRHLKTRHQSHLISN